MLMRLLWKLQRLGYCWNFILYKVYFYCTKVSCHAMFSVPVWKYSTVMSLDNKISPYWIHQQRCWALLISSLLLLKFPGSDATLIDESDHYSQYFPWWWVVFFLFFLCVPGLAGKIPEKDRIYCWYRFPGSTNLLTIIILTIIFQYELVNDRNAALHKLACVSAHQHQ